jgi:thiol-disulfide isomerase/thioredoxin
MQAQQTKPIQYCILIGLLLALLGCDSQPGDAQQNLSELRGHWLVINYWAVWCKPCRDEIPELNHFARENAAQVKVFGVNFDDARAQQLQQQVEELQIEFPSLGKDPAAELGYQRPSVLPTTVIVNPQGQVHRILQGPQTLASLAAAIGPLDSL